MLTTASVVTAAPAAKPAAATQPAARLSLSSAAAANAALARLPGQRAHTDGAELVIEDIAGLGPPWVGAVTRRGDTLWLVGDGVDLALEGPLARPRIAGPGYLIWVIGARRGDRLRAHRLGVLARPSS
jgi:hypothetical protein